MEQPGDQSDPNRSGTLGDIKEEELTSIETVMQTLQTPSSSTPSSTFALPATRRTDVTRASSSVTPATTVLRRYGAGKAPGMRGNLAIQGSIGEKDEEVAFTDMGW